VVITVADASGKVKVRNILVPVAAHVPSPTCAHGCPGLGVAAYTKDHNINTMIDTSTPFATRAELKPESKSEDVFFFFTELTLTLLFFLIGFVSISGDDKIRLGIPRV
jgi:hypothetical protein